MINLENFNNKPIMLSKIKLILPLITIIPLSLFSTQVEHFTGYQMNPILAYCVVAFNGEGGKGTNQRLKSI